MGRGHWVQRSLGAACLPWPHALRLQRWIQQLARWVVSVQEGLISGLEGVECQVVNLSTHTVHSYIIIYSHFMIFCL